MRLCVRWFVVLALGAGALDGCAKVVVGPEGPGGSGGSPGTGGTAGTGGTTECTSPEDCDDGNECTEDLCTEGACESAQVDDGTSCAEGECQQGVCIQRFACTEQGIRDAIAEGGGPHYFACAGPQTVTTAAEIVIDNNVILVGEGNLTVDANESHRVLSVAPSVTVELVGMTVSGGFVDVEGARGAGILNDGTLTITDSNVESNTIGYDRAFTDGGGIYNSGALTIVGSAVRDNLIPMGDGCGIFSTGTLALVNSEVTDNRAMVDTRKGCAITSTGTLTVIGCNITGNAAADGATVWSSGTLTMIDSAVGNNNLYYAIRSDGVATVVNSTLECELDSSIYHSSGTLTLISSTVVNSDFPPAIQLGTSAEMIVTNSLIFGGENDTFSACSGGRVTSGGYNIESVTDSCSLTDSTDLRAVITAQLMLGPLADNGGSTLTYELLPGSVAIDRIPESMCLDADGEPLKTDQRGVERPQGASCDIGAFELEQ